MIAGRRGVPLAVAMMAAAACSPASESSAPGTATASLELVAQIGCGDCDDDRLLTPAVLTLLSDNRIGVLNLYEPFVRVFGEDEELDVAFGRKGQGPGELGLDTGTSYLPGAWMFANEHGGVTVVDVLPLTLEAFDADGNFVNQRRADLPEGVPVGQASDPYGGTYYQLSFHPSGGDDYRRISRCRFRGSTEAECNVFAAATPFLEAGPPDALLGSLSLAATPEGRLVVANAGAYRIWILDENADVVVETGRIISRPAKSEEELAAEEERNQRLRESGRRENEIDPQRAHIESYGIQTDGAGRIWVLTQRYDSDNSVFDVFAADGTFLHEVAVDAVIRRGPWNITPFVAGGDRLAAIARQPDGNESVYVFRIVED